MNTFGRIFRITTWGESHGKAVGCVIDGCPSNLKLSEEDIQRELDRRKPGKKLTSKRMEEDRVEILSGVFEGKTTGAPISMIVYNRDVRSEHYVKLKNTPRPGHADLTYFLKYRHRDWRGGGRSSARETVGRVAGGAVAKKLINAFGINVLGYAIEVAGIRWERDSDDYHEVFQRAERSPLRIPDESVSERAEERVVELMKEGDSAGGVVEIVATNVPPGLGEPVFDKLSARLAYAVMGVPAVKGVEIGSGFRLAKMKGSESNDPIVIRDGKVRLEKNDCGGILGGISVGETIIVRCAIKPTPSISKRQRTVDIEKMEEVEIEITGRHDPCIVPRAVPVLESMVALTLADFMILQGLIPKSLSE
ncbi:chorismate synthase [Archaeoglobus sulfaticallidus PM70-1]|uniref:Chorismate synthase n=1 Tax=Archaeoglobus sulfaticallidus PM70-1 TaxID=387631 RepID=N0BCX7_9EURY|nr:chorismate synthase [Archaeoglobus sulfaticallidus]AGK60868.1 chorismate synthase [Archaeoglobus sulfaticallidus PM70-1]